MSPRRDPLARVALLERVAESSAEKADAAIEDVRLMAERIRRVEAAIAHPDHGLEAIARKLDRLVPDVNAARTKASGAHRLALDHERRLSAAEDRDLAFARDIGIALAEGQQIALRRDAKTRLVVTWTSVPVALAIIALIGRACFGG